MRLLRPALTLLMIAGSARLAASGTVHWARFVTGEIPVGSSFTVPLSSGSSVDVTIQTGGTQGVSGTDADTLGVSATGLDYPDLLVLGIFNGGGFSSVTTTITFSNIQVGGAHQRGFLLVGAVNGASSPITVSSSVPGRVATWSVVGQPFAFGPLNDFPITWNPASGQLVTTAPVGIDSRAIVLDLGDLDTDGTITIALQQHLNDGILFGLGEEVSGTAAVAPVPGAGLALASPYPNPARGEVSVVFSLPEPGPARLVAFDVAGRRVATIAEGAFAAGAHAVAWSPCDATGAPVRAGLLLLRLESASGTRTTRLLVVP